MRPRRLEKGYVVFASAGLSVSRITQIVVGEFRQKFLEGFDVRLAANH